MRSPSRKYTDLIRSSSFKWANWDPEKGIKVGDYGTINNETGQFERESNIYEQAETAALAAQYAPIEDLRDNNFIISSFGVKSSEFKFDGEVEVEGLAEASIKGRWEFGKKRGALLIMARPRTRRVPPDVFLKQLVKQRILKDKVLVTQVFLCSAYSLYLSGINQDAISVALVGSVPSVSPATSVGDRTWWSQHGSGMFREGCNEEGRECYTPLCSLKTVSRPSVFRRREAPQSPAEGDALWVDSEGSWGILDDEGEEEPWEDTVFD